MLASHPSSLPKRTKWQLPAAVGNSTRLRACPSLHHACPCWGRPTEGVPAAGDTAQWNHHHWRGWHPVVYLGLGGMRARWSGAFTGLRKMEKGDHQQSKTKTCTHSHFHQQTVMQKGTGKSEQSDLGVFLQLSTATSPPPLFPKNHCSRDLSWEPQ